MNTWQVKLQVFLWSLAIGCVLAVNTNKIADVMNERAEIPVQAMPGACPRHSYHVYAHVGRQVLVYVAGNGLHDNTEYLQTIIDAHPNGTTFYLSGSVESAVFINKTITPVETKLGSKGAPVTMSWYGRDGGVMLEHRR
jgi:hypothetical protein